MTHPDGQRFRDWLDRWYVGLVSMSMSDLAREAGGPENVAVVCADLSICFAKVGPLASERVGSIVEPVVRLFRLAHSHGVRLFVLPQDAHPADSPQFQAWGEHCEEGSEGARTVPELRELPFADLFRVIPKRNLNPGLVPAFVEWLDEHSKVKRFVVVGDCTDLCIYQLATYLRLRANQFGLDYEVLVPEDCVDTFDLSEKKAEEIGTLPHDGELMHRLFLYHMAINDIRIVSRLTG